MPSPLARLAPCGVHTCLSASSVVEAIGSVRRPPQNPSAPQRGGPALGDCAKSAPGQRPVSAPPRRRAGATRRGVQRNGLVLFSSLYYLFITLHYTSFYGSYCANNGKDALNTA
eukprot:7559862-Pyramimonas_sp.AAC.1